ncbi:MAG: leucyl aminopeptidase [Candidatus Kaiserbacteria bacterium]|nr:leucyl aminopeptidase [Candidatus Kaiserbacteria bacterium]
MRVVTKQLQPESPEVIVYSFHENNFLSGLKMLNASLAVVAERKGLQGEVGDVVIGMNSDNVYIYCVVAGSGGAKTRSAGGSCAAWAMEERIKTVEMVEGVPEDFVEGFMLRNYVFSEYKTVAKTKKVPVRVVLTAQSFPQGRVYGVQANHIARDLMNEPPNTLHPPRYAERIQTLFADTAVSVEVLGEETLRQIGMCALLAVGQGSSQESKVVIMRWNGGQDTRTVDLALVGKGITFDTGGISLKPSDRMDEMRWDMGGSAAVVSALHAAAKSGMQQNIVGVVGLVENMPDGNSYRPGDIVTSMSGKTIEIINTDAEGRMVLADALWYVQEQFSPREIIDFATLTGAVVVALGTEYGGLFSNNSAFAERLVRAGEKSGELVWQMPIHDNYLERMQSRTADLRNTSILRGDSGAGTAAAFLRAFVKKESVWAHIDIAGCALPSKHNKLAGGDPSGFGARFVHAYLTG